MRVYSTHTKKKAFCISKMSSGQPAEGEVCKIYFFKDLKYQSFSSIKPYSLLEMVFFFYSHLKHVLLDLLFLHMMMLVLPTTLFLCRSSSTEFSTTTAWGLFSGVFHSHLTALFSSPQVLLKILFYLLVERFLVRHTVYSSTVFCCSLFEPAGCVEIGENIINTTYIFSRKSLKRWRFTAQT